MRAGDWVEVMDRHVSTLDFPDSVTTDEMIPVGGADHLNAVVGQRAHAVHVALAGRLIRTYETDLEIAGEMMRLPPDGPQDLFDGAIDARMPLEYSEWRADVPNAVFPPNGEETIEVSLIEPPTIIGHEISHGVPALEPVDANKQVVYRCIHR